MAGVEAAGGIARQFVQGGELLGNEGLLLDVGGAQVVFGDLGGNEQAAAVELLLAAEGGGAGGVGIAAFLAEDIGLLGGAEAGGGEIAAVAEVGVAAVVAVAFGIGGEAGTGQEVGFGQAGGGDAVVVLQALFDEAVKLGIGPLLPPAGQVGGGIGLAGVLEVFR